MKPVPLSREKHAHKKVRPQTDYRSVAAISQLSLYGAELGRVLHEFPIAFSAQPEGLALIALTALKPGGNLFVGSDGKWLASYLPALLRRAPFLLGRVEDKADWILCIDEDSDLLSDREGQPLFGVDGATTEVIARTTAFLGELEQNRQATLNVCNALHRHELLVPWKPRRQNGVEEEFPGLFRVDEERLRQLPAGTLAELRDLGALPMIYAHLYSLDRVALLERLEAAQAQAARERTAAQRSVDLDRLFGIVEDEPFQF